jgi:hypothetical protein
VEFPTFDVVIVFQVMDITNMGEFEDKSFEAVTDKAAMDAMHIQYARESMI